MKLCRPKNYNAVITVPNIITSIGIILLIPYIVGFLNGYRWMMFGSLFLAGFSDLLDGFFARRLNQRTKIGEMIDPLRDRLIFLAVFVHFIYISFIEREFLALIGISFIEKEFLILISAPIFFISESFIIFFDYYWWKEKIIEARSHNIRKIRQAGLLFIAGAALLDCYFFDVTSKLLGVYKYPSLGWSLSAMSILSLITLSVYIKMYRRYKKNI